MLLDLEVRIDHSIVILPESLFQVVLAVLPMDTMHDHSAYVEEVQELRARSAPKCGAEFCLATSGRSAFELSASPIRKS